MMRQMRLERVRRGWTQRHVAQATGVGQSDISLYERGLVRPRPRRAAALEAAFGLPIHVLLADVTDEPSHDQ
jgi:transcriptional regulator with XRE-family HTH domain